MRGANLLGQDRSLRAGMGQRGNSQPVPEGEHDIRPVCARPELREIDPAGFGAPPREPLASAAFLDSLPSPRFNLDRVEFIRAPDRAGLIRLSPAAPPVEHSRPPEPVTEARPPAPTRRAIIERPVVVMSPMTAPPPEPIIETYYVAPIYTGIIVMNPVESRRIRQAARQTGRSG
jgi:hypothetical protein